MTRDGEGAGGYITDAAAPKAQVAGSHGRSRARRLRRDTVRPRPSNDPDDRAVAGHVFLSAGAGRAMADLGIAVPTGMGKRLIVGRGFDPSKPADYLAGFSIKRT